jgi:hypothetical protein
MAAEQFENALQYQGFRQAASLAALSRSAAQSQDGLFYT